jgi:hypothetical protein
MKRIKFLFPALVLAFLGACSTTQTLPPGGQTTESLVTACTSYASALHALTPFKSKLSATEINYVNQSNALAAPVCANPANYSTSGALQAIITETADLNSILKVNGGK